MSKQIYYISFFISILLSTTGRATENKPPLQTRCKLELLTEGQSLNRYFAILNKVAVGQEPVLWPSTRLTPTQVSTRKRAGEVIEMTLNEDPVLMEELSSFISNLGGINNNPGFWNKYFQAYDKTVGFNPAYVEIFLKMNDYLPQSGKILDAGAGTGNGSLLLSLLAPRREILGIDISDYGLSLAQEKLSFQPNFLTHKESLLNFQNQEFDAVFMDNVLYTLPDKQAAIKHVFEILKPGARLVISDPKPNAAMAKDIAKAFALKFIESSLENGSKMTEFELALVARLNFGALMKATHFLTAEKLIDLAENQGFKTEASQSSYLNMANLFVFRKP